MTLTINPMTRGEIEDIVRSVLQQYGVPLTLKHVMLYDDRWRVLLVPLDGAPVHVTLPGGPPHAVRTGLMNALQVEG